jgi:hypothetical protein
MRRLAAVCLAWMMTMPTPAPAVVSFLHPRSPLLLASHTGTDIPVQLRIPPHADNRAYVISWCTGASGHTLDGDDDAAIHPTMKPLTIRVYSGKCELTATVYGPGATQVRGRASMTLLACGGEEECTP